MSFLYSAYRDFITSPHLMAGCSKMDSIAGILKHLKRLWRQEHLSDDGLLHELHQCNQQPFDCHPELLRSQWLPFAYHPKNRTLSWCLPNGAATEPFHDQYIERCRQQIPLNQLIVPKTTLSSLLSSERVKLATPAGFIFHLSRCGSTLVSGSLSEIDNVSVLSESPLLTEVLLDSTLTSEQQQRLLPRLIRLQGSLYTQPCHIIVKWNAWDLMFQQLIRSVFPTTPILLIIRDPVEIMASHRRAPGRHMAGDPSLAHLGPEFIISTDNDTPFNLQTRVLRILLQQVCLMAEEAGAYILDYRHLRLENIYSISHHFNLSLDPNALARIQNRTRFHSKSLDRPFRADHNEKQQLLDEDKKKKIHSELFPLYQKLAELPYSVDSQALQC